MRFVFHSKKELSPSNTVIKIISPRSHHDKLSIQLLRCVFMRGMEGDERKVFVCTTENKYLNTFSTSAKHSSGKIWIFHFEFETALKNFLPPSWAYPKFKFFSHRWSSFLSLAFLSFPVAEWGVYCSVTSL